MATIQFDNGTKVQFDGDPTPKDIEEVASQLKLQPAGGSTAGAATPAAFTPKLSPQRTADIEAAKKYSATIAPNTESPSALGEAAKAVVNIPGSAWQFAKGAVSLLNPLKTVEKLKELGSEFKGAAQDVGGYGKAAVQTIKGLPKAAYETLVPEAGRAVISATGGAITGDEAKVTKGLETAQRAIVSDPVGQIAPFLLAGRAVAGKAGYGKQFDTAVSKIAQPVIKPIEAAATGVKNLVTGTARFGVGQATGLQPETISQIGKTPKAFTKAAQASADRIQLGQEVQSSLARRASALAETGEAYAPVRESAIPVKVGKAWLDTTVKNLTGLDIKSGKMSTSGAAKLRDAGDIRAVQYLYDTWKPVFNRGTMTPNEFLNFRTDLANLSKFERQIGKSQPVESFAKLSRADFNKTFRPQLKGLDKLDAEFTQQSSQLKTLSKGLVDKNGNLTDAAINKIANAAGKGKDILLDRLEETVPGITKKIQILKAVEDIQHASGVKVGTYARGAAIGGGFVLGGPIQGIVTAILTSPEVAVPLLRQYGLLKNAQAVQTVMQALRSGGSAINQLPNEIPQILQKDVNLKNIKPSAFAPRIK